MNIEQSKNNNIDPAKKCSVAMEIHLLGETKTNSLFESQTFQNYRLHADQPSISHKSETDNPPLYSLTCVHGAWEINTFLRVFGAMQSWDTIGTLWLFDTTNQQLVGQATRSSKDQNSKQTIRTIDLVWRSQWLTQPSPNKIHKNIDDLEDFCPHIRPPSHGYLKAIAFKTYSWLFRSSERPFRASDLREHRQRLKRGLQKLIGRRLTFGIEKSIHLSRDFVLSLAHSSLQIRKTRMLRAAQRTAAFTRLWSSSAAQKEDHRIGLVFIISRLIIGGADKSIIDLVSRLDKNRFRISVLTTLASKNPWHHRISSLGVACLHLPSFLHPDLFLGFVQSYIQSENISIVHVMNSLWAYENSNELHKYFPNLVIIDQNHVESNDRNWNFPLHASSASAYFSLHTVTTQRLKNLMVTQHGMDGRKIYVITTNVDTDFEFNPAQFERGAWRARCGIDAGIPIVLFLGRFADQKRPHVFLDAAEKVLNKESDVLFLMVGEGPDEISLRDRISKSETLAQKVRIFPATTEVGPILMDSDILFQPSQFEGLAYVSYEAMAVGLPRCFPMSVGKVN